MVLPPLIPDKHPELTAWRPQGVLQGLRGGVGVRYTLRHWDSTLNVRNAADKAYLTTCLARGDCFVGERRSVVGRVVYRF